MNWAKGVDGDDVADVVADEGGGGVSGQEKSAEMNRAHILAVSSWP